MTRNERAEIDGVLVISTTFKNFGKSSAFDVRHNVGITGVHAVPDDGDALKYAGRVGTGFTEAELDRLAGLLAPRATTESPFADKGLPRDSHFVTPELVAQVRFTEWTEGGRIRHPAYLGLRDDKSPADVRRE